MFHHSGCSRSFTKAVPIGIKSYKTDCRRTSYESFLKPSDFTLSVVHFNLSYYVKSHSLKHDLHGFVNLPTSKPKTPTVHCNCDCTFRNFKGPSVTKKARYSRSGGRVNA